MPDHWYDFEEPVVTRTKDSECLEITAVYKFRFLTNQQEISFRSIPIIFDRGGVAVNETFDPKLSYGSSSVIANSGIEDILPVPDASKPGLVADPEFVFKKPDAFDWKKTGVLVGSFGVGNLIFCLGLYFVCLASSAVVTSVSRRKDARHSLARVVNSSLKLTDFGLAYRNIRVALDKFLREVYPDCTPIKSTDARDENLAAVLAELERVYRRDVGEPDFEKLRSSLDAFLASF
jgi:hypothetical protein